MRYYSVIAALGLVVLAGCAGETDDGAPIDDPGEATEEVVGQPLHHYQAKSPKVFWVPGCGVRPPSGIENRCAMGLFVTFTRQYSDLDVKKTVSVDNTAKVITVKLDTFSKYSAHIDLL